MKKLVESWIAAEREYHGNTLGAICLLVSSRTAGTLNMGHRSLLHRSQAPWTK